MPMLSWRGLARCATPRTPSLLLRPRIASHALSFPKPNPSTPVTKRLRYNAPSPSPRASRWPPPPPPPPMPGRPELSTSTVLLGVFFALAVPITALNTISTLHPDTVKQIHFLGYAQKKIESLTHMSIRELRQYMRENYAFIPDNALDEKQKFRWWTLVTHLFSHGSILHLVFCGLALVSVTPPLVMRYGGLKTAGIFLGVGAGAALSEIAVRRYQISHRSDEQLVVTGRLPTKHVMEMLSAHVGSSGALMGMFVIHTILYPSTRWSFLLVPVRIPARVMLAGLVAWDVWGEFFTDRNDGIGHMGHLCGDAVGLLLYLVFLRRARFPRTPMGWR